MWLEMFQKIYLKDESLSYINSELSQGGKLSQQLLELDLEKGVVFTYIPKGFNKSDFSDSAESMDCASNFL